MDGSLAAERKAAVAEQSSVASRDGEGRPACATERSDRTDVTGFTPVTAKPLHCQAGLRRYARKDVNRLPPLLLAFALAGCAAMQPPTEIVRTPSADWHPIVTNADRNRLRNWREAFVTALGDARSSGHSAEIDHEGALLDPDAALSDPSIPAGLYRCRVTKLGAKSKGLLDYVAYPYFTCRIDQDGRLRQFAKLGGSQRQVGTIFPNNQISEVFLGTLMLGDEERAMRYGADAERDIAGFVQRVGPDRWRLLMPYPAFESKIDIMELVPASQGGQ